VNSLIDDIMAEGAEVRTQLWALLLRHGYPGNLKNFVLGAYVDVALEHHKAIWLLTDSKLYGSAFAMVRLVFDVYFRALWINRVATEQQIEQASQDEFKFPRMRRMLADIKQAYLRTSSSNEDVELAEQAERGFEYIGEMWKPFSSYTHSGGLQIRRRFTGDQVKSNYSENEIVEVLHWATIVLMMLLKVFFVSMGHYKEVEEIKTKRWWQQYVAKIKSLPNKS
jgi:hypothetical protein